MSYGNPSIFDSTLHGIDDDKKCIIFNDIPLTLRASQADEWFKFLTDHVHPEVERDRKDDQKSVRVAIFDTGVDAAHPDIALALTTKQIAEVKGFPGSLDPLQDRHGHGTHGASVLAKTAPKATLYIARVFDDQGNMTPENDYLNTANVSFSFHRHLLIFVGDSLGDQVSCKHHFDILGSKRK